MGKGGWDVKLYLPILHSQKYEYCEYCIRASYQERNVHVQRVEI